MPRADPPLLQGGSAATSAAPKPPTQPDWSRVEGGAVVARGSGLPSVPNFRDVASAHPSIVPGVLYRCACPDFCSDADASTIVETLRIDRRVDLRSAAERPNRGKHPMFRDADGNRRRCEERLDRAARLQTHRMTLPSAEADGSNVRNACTLVSCIGWLRTCGCLCKECCIPSCCRSRKGRAGCIRSIFGVWRPVIEARPLREQYKGICRVSARGVGDVLRVLCSGEDGFAALLHCTAGKDRTGVVIAVALAACGVPRDAICADYALSDQIGQQ